MNTPRLLAVHDLCSYGRCSLTAAIPTLSALGVQVCPFPTALFSNNLTYDHVSMYDFSPHMEAFMDVWEQNGCHFDAIYSGFLASADQIKLVEETFRRFATPNTFIIIDPAMGDSGELYKVFDDSIIIAMRQLIGHGTLITPNYTEACLLLDIPYSEKVPSTKEITNWCQALCKLGPSQVVITSIPAPDGEIKNVSFDQDTQSYEEATTYRVPLQTCGTGDLFTSAVVGYVLRGHSLHSAIEKTTKFLTKCIQATFDSKADSREGILIEMNLALLINDDVRSLKKQK